MAQISDRGTRDRGRGDLTPRGNGAPVSRGQRTFRVALWILGVIILVVLGVIVHLHKAPYPFELAATKDIQGPHPVPCLAIQQPHSPLEAALFDVSDLNNPIPSVIGGAIWLVGMLLLRLWRQALTLVVAVLSVGGLFLLLTPLVARPRPTIQSGICVHDHYAYFSFPSGHVSHDVVTYGFLLYVTLAEPVRRWRYRWLFIPFQLLFVFDLLTIGYSRLLEGDHWLLDVTGGYIVGILWLTLFIFLYRRFVSHWTWHRRMRQDKRAAARA
ncbi:MAG TPA: phosphatase PAP2 family protein [Ktedonobacteraceae bacterium]